MGNEIVRECKYYDDCDILMKDMDVLKKSDTLQEASLKSIHKRMDEANEKRDVQTKEIHELKEAINNTHVSLVHHMEWEEKLAEIREKEHKQRAEEQEKTVSKVKTFGTILFMAIFGLTAWFTEYMFQGMNDNEENIARIQQDYKASTKMIDNIEHNIEDIKKMLYPLTGGK